MAVVASQVEPGPGRSDGLEIRLLGPVALAVAGHEVGIGSPKQRVILAMLALFPRVTVDAIADALWRDTPPASVAATVHTLVSRLRRTLQEAGGGITIRSEGAGYVLDVESERVDVNRFEAAVAAGRRCLAEGATAEAARRLREALSLWRGPALDDLSDRDFARMAATRLDEARLRAAEELAEAELAGGAPAAALEVIEPLIARYPFHERLRGQEMLALYRLGRQADALAAFQDLRRCLVDELGLEPAPALVALERQILLQDAELDLALAPGSRPAKPSGDHPALAGTLAFLFTDIESSTSRWESDRAAMAADLAQHDELLGGAVAAHGGRRFTHTGDGLGAAFPTAASAIAAAVAGQAALAGATWKGVAPLRVRMGVHAGAAEARAGTFLGPTLNRAARLLEVARGGEILCSQAAADLAHDDLPPEATLVGRGERRLRGLSRPEAVWQVVHPALAGVVPPAEPEPTLASPDASLTSFIGRERELAELSALLGEARLVTITGVGGAGKTRLALELADQCGPSYPDGATVVELAPVGDDRPLAGVVLTALGLDAGGPSADAAEQRLAEALAEQQLLLVLDNCEHLIQPVAALVHRLLLHCPALTVLTTSREALSVPGETRWAAPGLSLPPEDASLPAELEGSDAAALFVARARLANPGFGVTPKNVAALTAICRRLDGIPLALELAAARVRALGVVQLAEHLDERFRLLTGGPRSAPSRHQTLAAAMDWSYEALTEPEQRLLRRLAVFPQRFDLPAATAVAGEGKDELDVLPLLGRLVDKSLLVAEGAAETARYRLLETVREYGARKLAAAGEDVKTAVLHRNHFVGLIADWNWRGENFFATEWMLRAAANTENFHAALVNALAASDTEAVTVLVAGLWKQWYLSGSVPPAVSAIEPGMIGCADPTLHIEALIGFSVVPKMADSAFTIRDVNRLGERALAVADTHGSRRDQGWARHWVAYFARSSGDVDTARALMQEALDLFTKERAAFELSYVHYELGWVSMTGGDSAKAIEHFRSAVAFSEEITGYEVNALQLQASLALAEAAEGDTTAALARARRAVEAAREVPLPAFGMLMITLIRAAETGAVARVPARPELAEALRLLRRLGGRHWVAETLRVAALLHEAEGRPALAARLLGGAVAVARELGEDPEPIPVVAGLVREARRRLVAALGAEFADQEAVGQHMPTASLLRSALEALD
jgi:predicted ATPase/DNA-binding SARP family transcriptional activator